MRKTLAVILLALGVLLGAELASSGGQSAAKPAGQNKTVHPMDMSTVSLFSNPNPSTQGQTVTFTASIYPSYCYGVISFKDNGSDIGDVNFSNGTATLQTSSLSGGTHSISAWYDGEDVCDPSHSSTLSQVVNLPSTTISLTSSLNPSLYGNSVTFTATVSPSAATGTVTFKDNTSTIGTGTLSGGTATFATSSLSVASHPITATYGGSSNYAGSTSSTVTQTVNKANSSTTVSSNSNPTTYGGSVTFTATVSPSSLTGTVNFYDNTVSLGTGTLSGGTATYTTSSLAAGSHPITASWGGNSNYNSSTSTTLTQVVNKANTTTSQVNSNHNPSTFGDLVTFTATITANPGTETGTVGFYDNGTQIGSGTVSNGTATYGTSNLSATTHSITAGYLGDSNFNTSSSAQALSQVVNKANAAIVVTSNLNPSLYGNSVTFTATVTGNSPTGTVTFYDFNGNVSLTGPIAISNGQATVNLTSLAPGSHSITGTYSGDANNAQSTSAVMVQTVNRHTMSTLPPYSVY